jgi:hypothetical protein
MRLPAIQGVIRRRILANYRVDPEVMQRLLPGRFRPKLQAGYAVAGICLIRLEHIRPKQVPEALGLNSENAAHRVAVLWDEEGETREGVFIARRDTGSTLSHLLGGRLFPGEHHKAAFCVEETQEEIRLSMRSEDGEVALDIEAGLTDKLPEDSIFASMAEASTFFEEGSVGFSVTHDPGRLDGLKLETKEWHVEALAVRQIHSSYFSDPTLFPAGSIAFDHALLMRDVEHEWHSVDDLHV